MGRGRDVSPAPARAGQDLWGKKISFFYYKKNTIIVKKKKKSNQHRVYMVLFPLGPPTPGELPITVVCILPALCSRLMHMLFILFF